MDVSEIPISTSHVVEAVDEDDHTLAGVDIHSSINTTHRLLAQEAPAQALQEMEPGSENLDFTDMPDAEPHIANQDPHVKSDERSMTAVAENEAVNPTSLPSETASHQAEYADIPNADTETEEMHQEGTQVERTHYVESQKEEIQAKEDGVKDAETCAEESQKDEILDVEDGIEDEEKVNTIFGFYVDIAHGL